MRMKIIVPVVIGVIMVGVFYFIGQVIKSPKTGEPKVSGVSDPGDLLNSPAVQELVTAHQKETTLLKPCRSKEPIGFDKSKMGGIPNLNGFEAWPVCNACGTKLNFVIQIYRDDFPKFYFPSEKNLFQLFRCPNGDCPDAFSDQYDQKMFHFYFQVSRAANKNLAPPIVDNPNLDPQVPDCLFKPVETHDYPNYDEYPIKEWDALEKKLGEQLIEVFIENYTARIGTKFNGYPSWTQYPDYPKCSCGRIKEFFFQLSSDDSQDGQEYPPPPDQWSPHGIMIGDVGNIYFFVCKECGEKSIETNWDCS